MGLLWLTVWMDMFGALMSMRSICMTITMYSEMVVDEA